MATDIIARGMAANAKKSVTELGDKIESEKWIGTKAEWEAVDKSTIKDGTIVYITDDETVILYDKAEMEKIAAQVVTDSKAAETAAQTAQSVADSLPDDYVTAVAKIAENTAEISAVKLTDKELQRRVDALFDMGQGVTHKFETDTDTAYAKTVPTGAKLMSVKNIGGRSIVWNQLADVTDIVDETIDHYYVETLFNGNRPKWTKGHKYIFELYAKSNVEPFNISIGYSDEETVPYDQDDKNVKTFLCDSSGRKLLLFTPDDSLIDSGYQYIALRPVRYDTQTRCTISVKNLMVFDLTALFGSGNEPTSVEEFEAMFPNDYYPYNVGEIISAGTESVVEQGKNVFDYTDKIYHGANVNKVENGVIYTKGLTTTVLNIPTIVGNKYTLSFKVKSNTANQGGLRWSLQKGKNISYAHDSSLIKSEVGYEASKEYQAIATFVADTDFVSLCTIVGMVYDVQLELGDTATDYSPFYQTAHPIPEAIRSLPGYGWSAGTARNYIDYENKKYYHCVGSVDLGTLTWAKGESVSFKTHHLAGQKLTKSYGIAPNFICPRYSTKTQNESWGKTNITGISATSNVGGYIYVNDMSYTDATAFKQAMSGVILYYELESPIITDISTLIDFDFLRNIEVEAGGSVTFKGGNDDYRIPVPSEEEYIVKLSEIGGTT